MSDWTGSAQQHLEDGNSAVFFDLVHIVAKRFADGVTEAVSVWTGAEPIALNIDGEVRTYIAAGRGLEVPQIEYSNGLDVRSASLILAGINDLVASLRETYDIDQATIEIHQLAQTVGLQTLGYRRLFKGFLDGASLEQSSGAGQLSINAVSQSRRGTRTYAALRDQERDPIFKYAAETQGDQWG